MPDYYRLLLQRLIWLKHKKFRSIPFFIPQMSPAAKICKFCVKRINEPEASASLWSWKARETDCSAEAPDRPTRCRRTRWGRIWSGRSASCRTGSTWPPRPRRTSPCRPAPKSTYRCRRLSRCDEFRRPWREVFRQGEPGKVEAPMPPGLRPGWWPASRRHRWPCRCRPTCWGHFRSLVGETGKSSSEVQRVGLDLLINRAKSSPLKTIFMHSTHIHFVAQFRRSKISNPA